MIVTDILVRRYTTTDGKVLHKIGTDEYYGEAVDFAANLPEDVLTAVLDAVPYTYEEADEPVDEEPGPVDEEMNG